MALLPPAGSGYKFAPTPRGQPLAAREMTIMELKRIAPQAVPAALENALRYRLLNEPWQAESICRDVLRVEPDNQDALTMLLLSLTDQFADAKAAAFNSAKSLLPSLDSPYDQAYYDGVVKERWAVTQLADQMPQEIAFDWLRQAMRAYEKAEQLSDPDNGDPILRWNACARIIMRAEARKRDTGARREVADPPDTEVPAR